MRRRNRPRRLSPMTAPLELRRCLFCGAEYMPNRSWQKYCCQDHSLAAHFARRFGDPTTAPRADAKPDIIAKLDDMPNTTFQDEQTEEATKAADVLKHVPTGEAMPAAKALKNLGYGIPELDEEDKADAKKEDDSK